MLTKIRAGIETSCESDADDTTAVLSRRHKEHQGDLSGYLGGGGGAGVGTVPAGSGQLPSNGGQLGTASSGDG